MHSLTYKYRQHNISSDKQYSDEIRVRLKSYHNIFNMLQMQKQQMVGVFNLVGMLSGMLYLFK